MFKLIYDERQKKTNGNYFDSKVHSGDVADQSFFAQGEQDSFPKCSLRFYTLSEIINSIIHSGFAINKFIEHPNFENNNLPGEFTIIANKINEQQEGDTIGR